jgi:hypothetical protein
MPTSKIVIKINDEFFLQKETLTNNPGKIIIDSKFPLTKTANLLELFKIYPALINAGSINKSIIVFQKIIDSISRFANNGKIESLFSVISNGEVVNLMRMAQDRSAFIGENLLNYYFIEVNADEVEQILNEVNEFIIGNPLLGIDYAYIRGELANIGQEVGSGNWADVPIQSSEAILTPNLKLHVDGFLVDENNNTNKPIKPSAKIATKEINEFKQIEPTIQNLNKTSNVVTAQKAIMPTSTIYQKITSLFLNCGIKLGTDKVNPEIKVVDLEQGWNFINNDSLYSGLATQPILGGGLNYNDKSHGQKTLNILFGRTASANRMNGLCIGANAQVASTWFNTSTSGERKEAALTSTLNKINIGDIVLLELQVDLKGGASKLPVEIDPAMNAVIQFGVHDGFIVIEAAGNGGHNLNILNYTSALINISSKSSRKDALMIGALNQANFPFLNRGLRVDYSCFGQSVNTSTPNASFDSTSLASAIVTGLVANFQSMSMATISRRLNITEIKTLLENIPTVPTNFNTFLSNNHIS